MATKKIKRFQEGGMSDEADKAAGLEASKDDKVGFLERLRMGNIDDSSSEAYRRFGAGRGRAARVPVEDRVGTPVEEIRARDVAMPATPATVSDATTAKGREEGMPKGSGDAAVAEAYSGPRTKPIEASSAAKVSMPSTSVQRSSSAASPKMQEPTFRRTEGDSSSAKKVRAAPAAKTTPATSAPSPRKSAMDMIPTDGYRKVEGGERINSSELGRNVNNALNAVVPGPARAFGAAKSAAKSGSRALQEVKKADTPVTYLGKSGRRQISGFDELSGTGGRPALGSSPLSLRGASDAKALEAPAKRLAYKKADKKADDTPAKRANTTSRRTKKFNDDEAGVEFKRGGKAMKSGGSVSPASKRADGIATRGKTRCKIC